jgi:hypothetical protein
MQAHCRSLRLVFRFHSLYIRSRGDRPFLGVEGPMQGRHFKTPLAGGGGGFCLNMAGLRFA